MPASVSLSHIDLVAPDGSRLFTDLSLAFGPERTGLVGRNGSGKSTLLRVIAGELPPNGGQVRVVGTLGMMTQGVPRPHETTIADLFGMSITLDLITDAERGCVPAEDLPGAHWTLPARMEATLARFGISADLRTPLNSLSAGQVTRARLAALVFSDPDVLLLDEPTNTLDREGRQAVIDLISRWKSAAVIASHDRELLESVDAIVELAPSGPHRYGGNYGTFHRLKTLEQEALRRDLDHATKTRAEVGRRAQDAAERKARKDGAGRRKRRRGGQSKVMMDFAKARAEASAAANQRLREARVDAAQSALSDARERAEVLPPLQMFVPPSNLPAGRTVLRLEGVTGGHDPERPVIRDLSLTITGPERVALSGPNGCGKSTLIRLIAGELTPLRGRIELSVPHAFLDQDLASLDPRKTVLDSFLGADQGAIRGHAYAALARFGFRSSDALRPTGSLSGGERLRAGLACTLGRTTGPMLLILDEPTNHLDMDAIAALEGALSQFGGAMIVVSHDPRFLEALSIDRSIALAQ